MLQWFHLLCNLDNFLLPIVLALGITIVQCTMHARLLTEVRLCGICGTHVRVAVSIRVELVSSVNVLQVQIKPFRSGLDRLIRRTEVGRFSLTLGRPAVHLLAHTNRSSVYRPTVYIKKNATLIKIDGHTFIICL